MEIDKLTFGEIKQIVAIFGAKTIECQPLPDHPFEIGRCYLIRTVTMVQTGRVVAVFPTELVLEDAAWIADTGRFANALLSLDFSEVEPFPDGKVIIGRGSIIDACLIASPQRKQK